jgi:hypothetical protein
MARVYWLSRARRHSAGAPVGSIQAPFIVAVTTSCCKLAVPMSGRAAPVRAG